VAHTGGTGYSGAVSGALRGPFTAQKQDEFRRIVRAHLPLTAAVVRKHGFHPRYLYVDLYAGPGRYPDGEAGSPAIFAEEAAKSGTRVPLLPVDAYFCEVDDHEFDRLQATTLALAGGPSRYHALHGDNDHTVDHILVPLRRAPRRVFGLVYADPNGADLCIDAMRRLAHAAAGADFLVRVQAASYKRVRIVHGRPPLEEQLRSVGRRHVSFGPPVGSNEYAFALLTNHNELASKFRSGVFHADDTPAGVALADRLTWTKAELAERDDGDTCAFGHHEPIGAD
jgi:hypothetical protein